LGSGWKRTPFYRSVRILGPSQKVLKIGGRKEKDGEREVQFLGGGFAVNVNVRKASAGSRETENRDGN